MRKALSIYKGVLAAMTIAIVLALCGQVMDIYYSDAEKAAEEMFRYEDVAQRLGNMAFPLAVYALAVIAGLIWQATVPENTKKVKSGAMQAPAEKNRAGLRIFLYAAAVVLLALGVMNGGLWDVLVKAINICTECIGLG